MNVWASATSSAAVTPSDTTNLRFRCLRIGGAGDVAIQHEVGGATTTIVNVLAGEYLFVEGGRVMATGTTATNITMFMWG